MRKLYLGLVTILLALGAFIYFTWPRDIITKVNPNLNAEQRAKYENQLAETKKQIAAIDKSTPSEQKAQLYFDLARTEFTLGEYLKAKQAYEKVIETYPGFKGAYYEYFTVVLTMRDYDSAKKIARQGLGINPQDGSLWLGLIGLERDHLGANDTALIGLYLEAMAKSGPDMQVAATYARFLEEKGNIPEALRQWKMLAALHPEVPQFADQVKRLEKMH